MIWIRALFAAGLSILLPGAGHALLRDWGRAVIFGGTFIFASILFLPHEHLWAAASSGAYGDMSGIVESEMSLFEQLPLSFLALFAAIDAGFQALTRASNPDDDDTSCPHCGKALDEDLEFCHWCTARLEPDEAEPARP